MKTLILLKELEKNKHGHRQGLFLCYCGKEFKTTISSVKNERTKSCGCSRRTLDYSERTCTECKRQFIPKQPLAKNKFCSHACSIKYNWRGRTHSEESKKLQSLSKRGRYAGDKNPNYKGGGVPCMCRECGKEFMVPKFNFENTPKHAGKFCSKNCCYDNWRKNKMTDQQRKIKKLFGRQITLIVKKYTEETANKWLKPLNYTVGELRSHLEKQFKEGMTWDNYGKNGWHIDHIKPVSYFRFETVEDEDFKKCWDLKNLQPLWEKENLRKGGKNTKLNQEIYG